MNCNTVRPIFPLSHSHCQRKENFNILGDKPMRNDAGELPLSE